jgi:hypothetical protein
MTNNRASEQFTSHRQGLDGTPDAGKYISEMKKPGTFAYLHEVGVLSKVIARPITVLSTVFRPLHFGEEQEGEPLIITFHNEIQHYNAFRIAPACKSSLFTKKADTRNRDVAREYGIDSATNVLSPSKRI